MGTVEFVVLVGAGTLAVGWWLKSRGASGSVGSSDAQQRDDVPNPSPLLAKLEADDEPDEATVQELSARGPEVVGQLVDELVADARASRRVEKGLGPLVKSLGEKGCEAFADALVRVDDEHRPMVLLELQTVVSDVGLPLVPALLARASDSTAGVLGEALGEIVGDAEDTLEDLEKHGLRAAVDAARAHPELARAFKKLLDAAVDQLSFDAQALCRTSQDPEIRAAAVACAYEIETDEVKAALHDPDERVRLAVATNSSLHRNDDVRVRALLSDPSPRVRAEAACQCGSRFADSVRPLLADPDLRVQLAAAYAAEAPELDELVDRALQSADPDTRLWGCRIGAELPDEKTTKMLAALQLDGRPAELAEFIKNLGAESLPPYEALVALEKQDPPLEIARAVDAALGYNSDLEGGLSLPARLLERGLPPRVRRVGFEALTRERDGRAERMAPYLVPDEPQLADFLWTLRYGFHKGLRDDERALLKKLLASPNEMLADFARYVLKA